MKYAIFAFVGLAIGLSVGNVQAQSMCWVDHVYQHGEGVVVTFVGQGTIYMTTHSKSVQYVVQKNGYQGYDDQNNPVGGVVTAVPMDIGDEATLMNSPEDSCTIHAVRKDGVAGIASSAFFFSNLPDAKPETRDEFVPAGPPPSNGDISTVPPTVPNVQP